MDPHFHRHAAGKRAMPGSVENDAQININQNSALLSANELQNIQIVKMRFGIFDAIVIAIVTGMVSAGCATHSTADVEGPPFTVGFNGPLKLVAKYKPLHLYVYADVGSTNQQPDYVIFERNEPLVISDNKSNTVEIIVCEKDFRGQFATTYDYKGQILKRSFSTLNNDSTQTNYLYLDTNGDGQWDKLLIDEGKSGGKMAYDRSNLCWVPRVQEK